MCMGGSKPEPAPPAPAPPPVLEQQAPKSEAGGNAQRRKREGLSRYRIGRQTTGSGLNTGSTAGTAVGGLPRIGSNT